MKASELGYTLEDIKAGIDHFTITKKLAQHTEFFTTQIARHIVIKDTSNDPEEVTHAKERILGMSNHYCQIVNAYGDEYIDLIANWDNEEEYSIRFHGIDSYYSVPKGTGYKNLHRDMTNQRIEFDYLGKLITPTQLITKPLLSIPKSRELHISKNPFALERCIIEV